MSKLYTSILFFSFLTPHCEVWGSKKIPKANQNSAENVPANLDAQIARAQENLERLTALRAQQEPPRQMMSEIIPARFSPETRELFGAGSATFQMMERATYHTNANTEEFKQIEASFSEIKRSDQVTVLEGIQNNINKYPGTPEVEILEKFLRDHNLDQESEEKPPIKSRKSKRVRKEDK